MIQPTPGRVVWFYTCKEGLEYQPQAATIAYAYNDRLVNLTVHTDQGDTYPQTKVVLVQEGDKTPAEGCFATWMPYQVEQARKYDPLAPQFTKELFEDFKDLRSKVADLEKQLSAMKVEQGKPFTPPDTAKPSTPATAPAASAPATATKK